LKERLPSYMIPTTIIPIDTIPLNENGKIDRIKLSNSFGVEGTITAIWKDLLNIDKISRYDNFFDLGGDSLVLIKMKIKLEEYFQVNISKIELFNYPTISELAKFITQYKHENHSEKTHSMTENKPFQDNDIAIIGMSCRFPGASTLEQFWNNLCAGIESIADIAENNPTHSNHVKRAAWVEDIELFDNDLFNYTEKEASILDPQQRILLECAWEALENAGYSAEPCQEKIGVFTTSEKSEYLEMVLKQYLDNQSEIGAAEKFLIRISNDKDYLSTRISYKLNLTGPSINVQTACSSSLVAIHLARQSLLQGECDLALVGAVALHIPQKTGYLYQEGMIASPDGYCRAFDAQANGTVFGNGAGVVILKPYSKAKADNDFIYAVIKGSAINNDGVKKLGYTAPSIDGQAAVVKMALADAKIKADSMSYVEAHGTGTPLGDPIEVAALTQAFTDRARHLPHCAIGSVKTNIGHLDSAAGMAGFIKTVLVLKNKQIPPSLHFTSPNPEIDFANNPFYVCQSLTPLPSNEKTSYAGVSSFGIGGTNSHIILSNHLEEISENSTETMSFFILPLSAKNQTALEVLVQQYISFLENKKTNVNLRDVCFTAAVGRMHFSHRMAVIGASVDEIIENLKRWLLRLDFNLFGEAKNYINGQTVNWNKLYNHKSCQRIPLPTYPFQKRRFWADILSSKSLFSILGKPMALPFSKQIRFENTFSAKQPAYNQHHRLFGKVVVPGSSHLAVFIAALNNIYPNLNHFITDIFFLNPFVISENEQCQVQVIVDGDSTQENSIKIVRQVAKDWTLLVAGKFQINRAHVIPDPINIDVIKNRCLSTMTGQEFYTHVWVPGLDTGASFRWIKKIWYTINQEAICCSSQPDFLDKISEPLHPGLIETCFQLLNACWGFDTHNIRNENFIYVPFSIQQLNFLKFPDNQAEIFSYARICEINQQTNRVTADVFLFDNRGVPLLEILGFEVRRLYPEHLLQALNKQKNSAQAALIQNDANSILEKIIQAGHGHIKEILYDYMSYLIQRILGVDVKKHALDYGRGFIDYGLDSLMSIELRNQLQLDLNLKLPATFAFDYYTIDQVVAYLENEFNKKLKHDSELISIKIQQEYDQLELALLEKVPEY
jgi:3-oxoacyl-(acyl-carrier-protein) synthase/acyl carrier protein